MDEILTVDLINKDSISEKIITKLKSLSEVKKVVVFGSFFKKDNPNDLDLAIFEDSNKDYLTISLKYRKLLRDEGKIIPLDILPIKPDASGMFLEEIEKGRVIYEKRD